MPKSDKTAANAAAENALNAAQVLFSLNPVHTPRATLFCLAQEKFLRDAEKFSAAWLVRRHDATRSTLDLVSQIANEGMKDPASAMKAMTDWQTHSLERLAEDARDYTEMMAHCIGTFVPGEVGAVGKTGKKGKRAAKGKNRKTKNKKKK